MPNIMRELNIISRCQALYRAARLDEELMPTHHSFALAICSAPARSQEELARALCLNTSTVTRTLLQMQERGLVRREENPADKRELLVYPTQKLSDLLPRVRTIAREWTGQITKSVDPEELAVFERVLHRLATEARATVDREEEKK